MPSGELYTVVLSRDWSPPGVVVLGAGDRSSSPNSLHGCIRGGYRIVAHKGAASRRRNVKRDYLPLRICRLHGGGLLALGRRDATFDGEGGAVRAGNAEAGGIATNLTASAREWPRLEVLITTHFAGMAGCVLR